MVEDEIDTLYPDAFLVGNVMAATFHHNLLIFEIYAEENLKKCINSILHLFPTVARS